MSDLFSNPQRDDRQIAYWLLIIVVLIFAMVVLGGVTRLTGSGLSIVEWEPIMGAIPPLNDTEWQTVFDKYRTSPEYQQVNKGMSLAEFKRIFAFEYAHRLLGRIIGLAFLLPLLYFIFKKRIRRSLIPKLVLLFILGGIQGFIGWYMVSSGLVNEPRVSQYRLATHLGLAVFIYAVMLWTAWTLLPNTERSWRREWLPLQRLSMIITGVIAVMILSGAFVAGTRAGKVFNSFPLMDGGFAPPGLFAFEPWYRNLFENLATVQFNHRLIAYLLLLLIPGLWIYARRFTLSRSTRLAVHGIFIAFLIQFTLGVLTLINAVPVTLGAAHQAGALVLLSAALYLNYRLSPARLS